MNSDAFKAGLLVSPGTGSAEVNNILLYRLTSKTMQSIAKSEGKVYLMLTHKCMGVAFQIIAAAKYKVDHHEEGAFSDGVASGLRAQHCV